MVAKSTDAPARSRLRAADRREQLLDAAADIVIRESFYAVTVEAIAQRSGVTRAVIYQHFADVDALLTTLVDREMRRARSHVAETTIDDLSHDAVGQLLDSLHAFLAAVQAHPTTWRLVLVTPEGAPKGLRRRIARGRSKVLADLSRAVQQALEGDDTLDADVTAHLLSAASDEYARLVLSNPRQYSPERMVSHAARLLTGAGHSTWQNGHQ